MATENKIAKVPVASHGLHKHSYNYPWLSSINFGDVMPCYINTVRKGERDHPKAGVFSQLMPIAHNAFATGRYNFKAIFVPYKLVWRPWYAFDQQIEFVSNGQTSVPGRFPFVLQGNFSQAFLTAYTTSGTSTNYDIIFNVSPTSTYHLVTPAGRRILRILGALGCMPSFIDKDQNSVNILPILCYIKAFADYYFPNNYVGSSVWSDLVKFAELDLINFTGSEADLLSALEICSMNYYENSVFDIAWDKPTTPNEYTSTPIFDIKDPTVSGNVNGGYVDSVQNSDDNTNSTNTPVIRSTNSSGSITYGVSNLSQFALNALKSVSMWAKRHQLAGARLLDRFLVSRGVTLSNDSARISYFLGQRNIEIEVSGVENNTDSNLGELAGRGVASSGNSPLDFECRADDDGIFLVVVSPLPDANFPILFDGFAARKDYMDNYHAEFDKLGSAAIPSRVVCQGLNGDANNLNKSYVFGWLNQYWDEIQERPRLLGDFILKSQGAQQLEAYHTFRLFDQSSLGVLQSSFHSLAFISMADKDQYQRLFYSDKQENLMLFLRWYGDQYKEKLPLGDSYEWDDDEMNKKVSLVVAGSQK